MPPPKYYQRFKVLVSRPSTGHRNDGTCHLCKRFSAVELEPGPYMDEYKTKQVLMRIGPLHTDDYDSPGIQAFTRLERAVAAMNRAKLAVEAAERQGPDGIAKLFKYYWDQEA